MKHLKSLLIGLLCLVVTLPIIYTNNVYAVTTENIYITVNCSDGATTALHDYNYTKEQIYSGSTGYNIELSKYKKIYVYGTTNYGPTAGGCSITVKFYDNNGTLVASKSASNGNSANLVIDTTSYTEGFGCIEVSGSGFYRWSEKYGYISSSTISCSIKGEINEKPVFTGDLGSGNLTT